MTIGEQIQQMLPELIVDKAKSYVNFDLYDNEGHSIMTGCARRAELWDKEYNESKDFISISALKAEIDSAKTIARPQAEWICKTKSTFPQYQPDEFECSSCKQVSTQKYNFCPYCGAGMRGDKND